MIYMIYIYIYIYISIYNTSKVFKQRKQLVWDLNFYADTAATFSQMNKMINLQYHGIFCILWLRIEVFTKCFHRKSVCPVIQWATGRRSQTDSWKQSFYVKRYEETVRGTPALVFAIIRYQRVLFFLCLHLFNISVSLFRIFLFLCNTFFSFSFKHS